jgi:hypothetical protein
LDEGIHQMTEHSSPKGPAPRRVSRWSPPPSSRHNPYRLVFRLVGIPLIAVAAVLLYRGLQGRFVLPECDSDTAKQTLAQVLKELKLEPAQYAPIKTVSTSKTEVVCNAVMPLPGGGNVVADYSFYWQGNKANMRYSIRREPAQSSWLAPRFIYRGRFDVRSRT